jgi:two-component system cell cycle response regulator
VTSVVVIAENATVEQAVAVVRMGAEDYLKKPFNLEAFQLAVKRGLDRKTVFGGDSGASSYLNLVHSCQMISATLDPSRIFAIVQSHVMRELKSDYSAIYRIESGQPRRFEERESEPGVSRRDRAMEEVLDIALHASGALQKMAEAGEIYRFIDRGQLTPGLFIFRFRCTGPEDLFCVCLSPQKPAGLEEFENRLKLLRTQLEVTGRNVEQYQGVERLVYMDDATGLYNTRYLYNILEREIEQAQANHRSFAILFIDGDKFKGINDTYGHLAGTKLLNELGNQLKRYVRGNDTVFRYGGDEFVAVLSNADLQTAQRVAERIRASIERHVFLQDDGKNIRITVSIGVALFPDHADSIKAVIDAADHAMYSAKRKTRNSVFIAPLPEKTGATPAAEGGEKAGA